MKKDTIVNIEKSRLIVNMKGFSADTLLYTVEAMIKGGIGAVEIVPEGLTETAERECSAKIAGLKKCFGKDLTVGAANVFTERFCKLAKGAGADFISCATLNKNVISRANALDLCVMSAGFTPTEIADGFSLGADFVRLFPTKIGNDWDHVAQLAETFKGAKIVASGGVDFEDILPLYKAGIKYFSIGGSLANVTLANKKEYDIITKEAERYCNALAKLK